MESKNERKIYVAVAVGVGVWILSRLPSIFSFLGAVTEILFPILLGLIFAFLLHLPLRFLERAWDRLPTRRWRKGKRAVCLALTVILTAGAVWLLILLAVPRFFEALSDLMTEIPEGVDRLWEFANRWSIPLPLEKPNVEELGAMLDRFLEQYGDRLAAGALRILAGAFGTALDFGVALILALYILAQKERLGGQGARLLRAVVSPALADRILRMGSLILSTFSRFFAGQMLEALILGGLCFLGMSIMGMPFALLVSVIVGVSALIPIFGAFVGGAAGGLLILSVSPLCALWFVIFLIALQQLEDGLIYPRIMGRSVGLPGIWVLSSVIVGGALGIGWIFVSVPIASVIYALLREFVQEREKSHLTER